MSATQSSAAPRTGNGTCPTVQETVAGARLPGVVALCALAVMACDPCSGTVACGDSHDVSAFGQLIEFRSGKAVGGVELVFRRSGGIELSDPERTVTTDGDGWYSYRVEAREPGSVTLSITVRPPGPYAEYTVEDVVLSSSSIKGEGHPLGRWVVNPFIAFVGEVRSRTTGKLVTNGAVSFVRRGGIGMIPDSIETNLGPFGRFFVFPEPMGFGEVLVDVTVRHPSLGRPRTTKGIRVSPRHVDEPIDLTRIVGVGPSLHYVGVIYRRGSDPPQPPAAGTLVEFRRTGGIAIIPDRPIAATQPWGGFAWDVFTSMDGTVVGDIVVHLPEPLGARVIRGVRMETFEDDPQRLLGQWMVGPSLSYVGELRLRSGGQEVALVDLEVEFQRTGGIQTITEGFRTEVQPWGAFGFRILPMEDGELTGTLIVDFPDPFGADTIPDVVLSTFDADGQRVLDDWSVGRSLNYAGEVYMRDAGTQVPLDGATVQFRRTGGVQVSPDTFTVTTKPWGGFSLSTFTSFEGEVEAEIVVDLPAPRGADTIRGIVLRTFESEEQRFAGRWGAGAQINYAVGVFDSDTEIGIGNVDVRFERTGGIAVEPDTFTVTTAPWGAFAIQVSASEEGEVIADLVVLLESGPRRISGVRIPTFKSDEFRLLGWYGVRP